MLVTTLIKIKSLNHKCEFYYLSLYCACPNGESPKLQCISCLLPEYPSDWREEMTPSLLRHWLSCLMGTLSVPGVLGKASSDPHKLLKFPLWDSGPVSLTTAVSSFPQIYVLCAGWGQGSPAIIATAIAAGWLAQPTADTWTQVLNLHTSIWWERYSPSLSHLLNGATSQGADGHYYAQS